MTTASAGTTGLDSFPDPPGTAGATGRAGISHAGVVFNNQVAGDMVFNRTAL